MTVLQLAAVRYYLYRNPETVHTLRWLLARPWVIAAMLDTYLGSWTI